MAKTQHVPPVFHYNPQTPDEQEFIYSYDPETEINMDDETWLKERIQRALWRSGGFRVIPPPSPLVQDFDADEFLRQVRESSNEEQSVEENNER